MELEQGSSYGGLPLPFDLTQLTIIEVLLVGGVEVRNGRAGGRGRSEPRRFEPDFDAPPALRFPLALPPPPQVLRNQEEDPEKRIYPGGPFDPLVRPRARARVLVGRALARPHPPARPFVSPI